MTVEPGKFERAVGYFILTVLAVILLGVYHKQLHFDPAVFSAPSPNGSPSADISQKPGAYSDLQIYIPSELVPLTPLEIFAAHNLSDKIDGKAELYLSSGFAGLKCQRFFSSTAGSDLWLELYIYDMGSMRSAFSVYSAQRRADAEEMDQLARFAYKAGNALFFVHGRYYVEIVSAAQGLDEAMTSIALNFIEREPVAEEQMDESSFFPRERLIEGSVSLHAANVFGFASLENVFTAKYDSGELQLTAFLSRHETSESALETAEAYHRFLLENGGSDLDHGIEIPGARLTLVFDTFEVIFSHDNFLAGVHEAESRSEAEELALKLYQKLIKAGK